MLSLMSDPLRQLELLAEIDMLVDRLRRWADEAPDWQPAEYCRAVVRRLIERTDKLRMRLEAPLIVATLGGTGTGKSALVNALLGETIVSTGRQRPTTLRPAMLARPGLSPELLGIDPSAVELVALDRPLLQNIVLIDCPDPDTTEEYDEETAAHRAKPADDSASPQSAPSSNLQRLRAILPHCDVLIVATTQQKYRSAVVAEELAAAAPGARLVFVQTHADRDDDVRADWQAAMGEAYATGRIFRVDSLAALADAQNGRPPQGEFAALVDLLGRQLAGAAAVRIRRANFLDLAAETLARCRARIEAGLPAIDQAETAIEAQRAKLLLRLAGEMREELLASRRQWEQRLVDRTASRWGFSPFALVLRAYQGLGGLLSGVWLARARSPAQFALWGAVAGVRSWQQRQRQHTADRAANRALAGCWDDAELQGATIVLEGYARDAGLPRAATDTSTVAVEAQRAGAGFVDQVAGQINGLINGLADRHTGWFGRMIYEFLFLGMLSGLLFRLGKNFFYDSWLAPQPTAVHGVETYLASLFWLLLWCVLLLWALTRRLRRGLRRELDELAIGWTSSAGTTGLFASLEAACRDARRYREQLVGLEADIARLQRALAPAEALGHFHREG
jgi:hypothetical protein